VTIRQGLTKAYSSLEEEYAWLARVHKEGIFSLLPPAACALVSCFYSSPTDSVLNLLGNSLKVIGLAIYNYTMFSLYEESITWLAFNAAALRQSQATTAGISPPPIY